MTALIQSAEVTWAGGSQGSAKTITLASAATLGSVVIVEVTYEGDIINSVSGLGATWNVIRSREGSSSPFPSAEIWYGVVTSASTTITVTPNPGFVIGSGRATAREFSGLDGTVVTSSTTSSQSSTTSRTSPALTTAAGNVYVAVMTHGSSGSATAPTSTTESPAAFTASRSLGNNLGGTGSWGYSGARISAGSETPTLNGVWAGAENGIAVAAVFNNSSSSGSASLTLSGSGTAGARATASAALSIVAGGTGTPPTAAAGTAALSLGASGTAIPYTDLRTWSATDSNGSVLEVTGGAVGTVETPVADAPPNRPWERRSSLYDPPASVVDGFPVGWTAAGVDIEDLGQLQVVVDGVDRSRFRGKRTQIGGWSSVEAGGDETLTLRFPRITTFDHPGSGEVAWLHDGAHVGLNAVSPLGVVTHLWTGQYVSEQSDVDGQSWGYTAQCQGVCFGADRHALPATVRIDERDIGEVIPEWMNGCISRDWATMPNITTGVTTRKKGPAPQRFQLISQVLATAITGDGLDQWTIDNIGWRPVLKLKDRTTIHATIRAGQPGARASLRRDVTTAPNVIYGEGTRADGMRFRRMVFPGARLTDAPLFPLDPSSAFTPGGADTGFGPFAQEMRDYGYTMHSADTYDPRDEAEVRDAQTRAGVDPVNGHVGSDTWALVFAVGGTSSDLNGAYQAPMAIIREVDPWVYNARGEKTGPNPFYDPSIVRVERYEDFGEGSSLALARSSARGELNRSSLAQWSGTVTLTKDPNEISRFFLRAGMNLLLQDHHGIDRQLHIAGVQVDWKAQTVTLTVDQLNRDLITLAELRARNRETSTSPLRRVSPVRSAQMVDTYTIWDGEAPTGRLQKHAAAAGRWVVIPVAAGQTGTITRFVLQTSDSICELAAGIFGLPVTTGQLDAHVGNPFDAKKPWDPNRRDLELLGIQAAWGGQDQPGGYGDLVKGDPGVTLTGELLDAGGFSYATDFPGTLWLAYWVRADCYIEGRMTPGVEGL